MATPMAASRARAARSEEGDALFGVVMAISAASGAMIAAFAVADGGLPVIAAPTIVLVAALVDGAQRAASWAGVVLWLVVLPTGNGIGILAPAAMAILCLAFAIGPERLLDWVRDEWMGREEGVATEVGWIEEDPTAR
jgi:hypothetical protein